jgi:uncharacterized YccA/Bax inhibitor family protein
LGKERGGDRDSRVELGLTVGLVWLYLEILRLLSYFYSSDR